MENLRFAISAGETKRYETAGRYLEIIDSAGPVTLTLYGPDGGIVDAARDILSGTYCAAPFAAFTVTSATAQTVELFTAAIEAGTKRQPGNVRIIDSSADKTIGGLQFLGQAGRAAAAGVSGIVGLLAGARRVAIRRITISSSIAGPIYFGLGSAIPTTNYSSAGNGISKLYGGAITTSNASRFGATAANSPPIAADIPGVQGIGQIMIPANVETELLAPDQAPIVLSAANVVFWVHGAVVNRDLSANFDFEELT